MPCDAGCFDTDMCTIENLQEHLTAPCAAREPLRASWRCINIMAAPLLQLAASYGQF